MNTLEQTVQSVLSNFFNVRTVFVFIAALAVAYILSRILAFVIIKIAHIVGHFGDAAKTAEHMLRLRRAETYLSVGIALVKVTIFVLAIIIAWIYTHPGGTEPLTIIGASTIFFVLAGATLTPTLRDITAGSLMILEKWYNVGDFVTFDPYYEESGVVERMNLRSTRIRKLNGEVAWVHNQYIQRVSVAPKGVRTMAIDLYVDDFEKGKKIVSNLQASIHIDPTMLARPLEITETAHMTDDLCLITVIGGTPPGREWVLEKFAVSIIEQYEAKQPEKQRTLVYEPIVRYADTTAERRFKRAMQIKPSAPKSTSPLRRPLKRPAKK